LCDAQVRHQAQQAALARAYPHAAERLLAALGLTSENVTSREDKAAIPEHQSDPHEGMSDICDKHPDGHAVGVRYPDVNDVRAVKNVHVAQDVHVKRDRQHDTDIKYQNMTKNHNVTYNKKSSKTNQIHVNTQETS
jgi:hypothetical protein